MRQETMQLYQALERWSSSLPMHLQFWAPNKAMSDVLTRECMLLGSQFNSVRMLLTQPCLNEFIRHQGPRIYCEASFTQRMSTICFNSARTMIEFLPEDPHPAFIYNRCPWWCWAHHLVQAASVLLLSLLHKYPQPWDGKLDVCYLEKVVLWLQVMNDEIALQAAQVIKGLLDSLAR